MQDEIDRCRMEIEALQICVERSKQAHRDEIIALTRRAEMAHRDEIRTRVEARLNQRRAGILMARRLPAFLKRYVSNTTKEAIAIVSRSPNFDRDWYLSTYPDVQASGMDAARHFVLHGLYEGRRPSQNFDPLTYLAAHPDALETDTNPIVHASKPLHRNG